MGPLDAQPPPIQKAQSMDMGAKSRITVGWQLGCPGKKLKLFGDLLAGCNGWLAALAALERYERERSDMLTYF